MTNAYNPGSSFRFRSSYAPRIDPIGGRKATFHAGQDFSAPAGTPIPTATSGIVVYSGYNENLGNVVIVKNDTGDYSLYGHMLDGSRPELGQRIWPGDSIGLAGSTGARTTGPHLHYAVIKKDAGDSNKTFPSKGGGIGIRLNPETTFDPATYGNYDPTPRYLDETSRAAALMSGNGARATSGPPFSAVGRAFDDRFGKWASTPAGVDPKPIPDSSASFDSRSGSWGYIPMSSFDDPSSPGLREVTDRFGNRRFSSQDDAVSSPARAPSGLPGRILDHIERQNAVAVAVPPAFVFDAGAPAVPFVPDDGEDSFADRFGDRPPVRRLSSRLVRR